MFFVMTLVPVTMLCFAVVTYWRALASLGLASEVIARAPRMLPLDAVALLFAAMVVYWALQGWSGFMLPFLQSGPLGTGGTSFMALLCCLSSMAVAFVNAGDRFTTPTVAGLREAAVRTVVTLRILDRAEDLVVPPRARKGSTP